MIIIKSYERIHIDKDEMIYQIAHTKNRKELAEHFGCGINKVTDFIKEQGLYKYYCEHRKGVVYKPQNDLQQCCVCNSSNGVHRLHGKYYCKMHYNQMYRYGKIIERTIYSPNDFIFEKDICKIVLRHKDQSIKGYCIIDSEDYDKVKEYKWYLSAGYCITKGINKNNGVDIANVIFNTVDKAMYDHQNHNKLDNRKFNLREVTSHQNSMNMGKKYNNTTGVTGVQKQSPCYNRWQAALMYNYKTVWLGSYITFDEAVLNRLLGECQYFKEYSPNYKKETNMIELTYISLTDDLEHYIAIDMQGHVIENKVLNNNRYAQKIS